MAEPADPTFYRSSLDHVIDLDRDEWVELPVTTSSTVFGDTVMLGRHQLNLLQATALSQMLAAAVVSLTSEPGPDGSVHYPARPLGPTERSEPTEAQSALFEIAARQWQALNDGGSAGQKVGLTVLPGGKGA